jgi:hypothetical protein
MADFEDTDLVYQPYSNACVVGQSYHHIKLPDMHTDDWSVASSAYTSDMYYVFAIVDWFHRMDMQMIDSSILASTEEEITNLVLS